MNQLEENIKQRITEQGRITFAEFMEMVLFFPKLGYYMSSRQKIGFDGDFFTSPATHPVFSALISIQLEQMWQVMGRPSRFTIVEMGAGKGLLADDILSYLPNLAQEFSEAITYVTIERNSASVLQGNPKSAFVWPNEGTTGCILSNELLDAFPVHRVKMTKGHLLEVYVTLDGDELIEILDEPSTSMLEERLSTERITLDDGYSTEINLNIDPWMEEVAHCLKTGYLLTIDYGYGSDDLYSPQHHQGTLMTYYRHAQGVDPFMHIGHQDITTHVDLTAVILSGERRGLKYTALTSQREFCFNLGLDFFMKSLERLGLSYSEYIANRSSMLELVRYEGMGGFKVLVQCKGLPQVKLYGLTRDNEWKTALNVSRKLPVPLLTQKHMPLLQGRYPHFMDFDTDCFHNRDNE